MEEYGMAIIKTSWEKVKEDNEKDNYSSITPSGFKQQKYDTSIVSGGYLYHRCHLIAWKLGGIDVNGKLHFNVYVYNVQNGIVIDYATGESKLAK